MVLGIAWGLGFEMDLMMEHTTQVRPWGLSVPSRNPACCSYPKTPEVVYVLAGSRGTKNTITDGEKWGFS